MPRRTVTDALADQMIAMQAAGRTLADIALECGVARSTVAATLRRYREGTRKPHQHRWGELEAGERLCKPPRRCSEGHLCYVLPCRTCAFERLRRHQRP